MKKSMLILIVTALLTSCTRVMPDPDHVEENCELSINSASFSENNTESESYDEAEKQPSTECKISTTETTVATEIQSETVCTTTAVTDMQKDKSQNKPQIIEQQKDENTVEIHEENHTDTYEYSAEKSTEKTSEPPQVETIKTTENIMEEVKIVVEEIAETEEIQPSTEPAQISLSDYEKALSVYEYMTKNGSGTCVQYAYLTYEKCLEIGLECYFAWTENQLYGHVANVVKMDGIWYVLDTQAGCFLTENMCGFTEIVDANESFVASAEIISKTRY